MNKKAIVNMKNNDDKWFMWCVARALNLVDHNAERISKVLRKQAENLDWSGIEFPVAVKENVYGRFERNNNISLNVFGYRTFVFLMYVSKHQSDKVVELLLISDNNKKHYTWIKKN